MNLLTTALIGLFLLSNVSATSSQTMPEFPAYTVAMTGYNAVPEQTDDSPDVTASGAYSNPAVIVARSVDLADKLPYGTIIAISHRAATSTNCGIATVGDKIGYRVVADSMHPRKRNQIDLLFAIADSVKIDGKETNPAVALGVCTDVEIRVVGKIDISHMPHSQAELKKVVDGQLLAIKK